MVADSYNFKELDFIAAVKILSSDKLNIDSELQVFTAAGSWLSYNINVRGKYTRYLFSNIRVAVLSDHALKYHLSKISSTYKNEQFIAKINQLLQKMKVMPVNKLINYDKVRFCSQSQFNIILCCGYEYESKEKSREAFSVDLKNLTKMKTLRRMKVGSYRSVAVCMKNEIYLFGDEDEIYSSITSIYKYSFSDNT